MAKLFIGTVLSLFSNILMANGYLGIGNTLNNTNDFDHESDGPRLDIGAKIHPNLNLEWSFIDLGQSTYNDPTFVPANTSNNNANDDTPTFSGSGFGASSGSIYKGISEIHVKGIAAGLNLHGTLTNDLGIYQEAACCLGEDLQRK